MITFLLNFQKWWKVSQINDTESLNFESLKYNPSDK